MAGAPERVELELWLCPGADCPVAVALHIVDPADGTPTRSFGPQLRSGSFTRAFTSPASRSNGTCDALDDALLQEAVEEHSSASACPVATLGELETAAAGRQLSTSACSSCARTTELFDQVTPVGNNNGSCHAAQPVKLGTRVQEAAAPATNPSAVPPPQEKSPPRSPISSAQAVEEAIQEAAAAAAAAAPVQQEPGHTASEAGSDAAVTPAVAAATATRAADPAGSSGGAGSGTQAALASVMGMLQRLLEPSEPEASAQAEQHQHQQQHQQQLLSDRPGAVARPPPALPQPASSGPVTAASVGPADSGAAGSTGSGPLLPGGVQKLLALELEVVQLQQSLQIAQLEFETRSAQLYSLKQRAEEAEQRAQAERERASGLAHELRQLERQVGDLRCQLGEAAARHRQETAQLAAQLAAAAAKQQAAEQEAARVRQELSATRQAADTKREQLRRVAAQQRAEWQEQAAAVQAECQQLRYHISAACVSLQGVGIPANKVFGPSALAAAGVAQALPASCAEPAELSSGIQQAQHEQQIQLPLQAEQQVPMRRPLVPRLQLSCISLQELQAQASPTPQGLGAGAAPACVPQEAAVVSAEAVAGAPGQACGQRPSHDVFAHVLAAADGTAALGDSRCVAAGQHSPIHATGAAAGRSGMAASAAPDASPASSVQQSSTLTAPLLTSRRAVSPAQQELLATARQWQRSARAAAAEAEAAEDEPRAGYPPPLPSARGSCRGPAPPSLFARGGGAAAAAENACPPRSRPTPRAAAVGATPRHAAASSGAMAAFPGHKLVAARAIYGQDPTFQEVKAAYNAVMSSEADRTSRWARSVFSSASAVDADPARVDHMVQGLLQLFDSNGLPVPLHKCGQCMYRLGPAGCKLSLRLVNGRLMARSGAGQTLDVLAWLEKQPAAEQQQRRQQHPGPLR